MSEVNPCSMTGVVLHGTVSLKETEEGKKPEALQGYLARKKTHPPQDPTVCLCLGS